MTEKKLQVSNKVKLQITGQLADMPSGGLPTQGLINSQTGQIVDIVASYCTLLENN